MAISVFHQEYGALLLRGLVHNFAGPLTTLIGYSQLISKSHPEHSKESSAMVRAATKLEAMLTNLSARGDLFTQDQPRNVNVNDIILMELDFLEADPVYKHKIKKQIILQPGLATTVLRPRYFALGFNLLMQTILSRARAKNKCALLIQTYDDDKIIYLKTELTAEHAQCDSNNGSAECAKGVRDHFQISDSLFKNMRSIAFSIFEEMGFEVRADNFDDHDTVWIKIGEDEISEG